MGEREAAETALNALEQVDLKEAANKRIGAYSKGMRQRVKLAQAIAHAPELLILDEPLSGMDPLARRKTIRLLRNWAAGGRNVIVSSHILHEVEALTSDILLMHHGRVLAEGNVHQIRDLIDEHPHTVCMRTSSASRAGTAARRQRRRAERAVRRRCRGRADREARCVLRAADRDGRRRATVNRSPEIYEVTSPDDNLQAVFDYLVKS